MKTRAHILVVDDNEDNRDALSRRLRTAGYQATPAEDGAAALRLLAQVPFDLVLLDVEMPGTSGFEVLSTLRAAESTSALPVIMVTARVGGEDVVEALSLGANDYVTKPIDFQVALARIDTHLSHRRAVEQLRISEERYALAVNGANDGLFDWNVLSGQVYWSPRWQSILGLEGSTVTPNPEEWLARVHPEDRSRVELALYAHLDCGTGHFENEHRVRHSDDTYRWVRCRGAAVRTEAGAATRFAGSLTDITDAKLADPLTGLPNRLLFLDVAERAIKRSERRPDYGFAILVLALDRLRMVHDSLGAAASDRLIVAVAKRLLSGLRGTDVVTRDEAVTLARHGGDEFTVLVDDVNDSSAAIAVAERLRHALDAPFEVDGQRLFVSARIGIAVSGERSTAADILRDATIALNRATSSVPYEIFDPEMRKRAMTRLTVETDLRQAIDQVQFEVHYQPIVSLTDGRIAAFEALVRWRHPQRGLVQPMDFIGIAEESGLIAEIDRLTLWESCRQMAEWIGTFGAAAPGLMCANISGRQLGNRQLMTQIDTTLRAAGLPAASLKLEITEHALIGDAMGASQLLERARALGVAWSLDDFGTGYSSLSMLHKLQVNTVKVDRSFVSAIGADGSGLAMVRGIVGLAHALGMDVVAEGVETAEQAAALRNLGCEYAQGFYFSRAVETVAAGRLIEAQPWQRAHQSQLVQ